MSLMEGHWIKEVTAAFFLWHGVWGEGLVAQCRFDWEESAANDSEVPAEFSRWAARLLSPAGSLCWLGRILHETMGSCEEEDVLFWEDDGVEVEELRDNDDDGEDVP